MPATPILPADLHLTAATAETTSAPARNPWPVLLRVALLGTRQCAEALPTLPGFPGEAGQSADPATHEKHLLLTAGALALMQKAGNQMLAAPAPHAATSASEQADALAAAASDTWPVLSPAGQTVLRQLLQGPPYNDFIANYFVEMVRYQRRLPPALLVPVLNDYAARELLHISALTPVLGERGRWLVAQNPAWKKVARAAEQAAAPAVVSADFSPELAATLTAAWETGSAATRTGLVRGWHPSQPALVRTWLAEAIATERAEPLAELVAQLAPSLTPADEPLLAPLLLHKAKTLRQAVAPLLASIPGSALVERLWQRAAPLLAMHEPLLGAKKLIVNTPATWDKTWLADGIEEKDASYVRGGERAQLLSQLLALLPPARWRTHLGQLPTLLLTLAQQTEWDHALLAGWARATLLHRDATWALALLQLAFQHRNNEYGQVDALFKLLPERQQLELLLAHLPPHTTDPPALVFVLLGCAPQPWPAALTTAVLAQVQAWAPIVRSFDQQHRQLTQVLPLLARAIDPTDVPRAAQALHHAIASLPEAITSTSPPPLLAVLTAGLEALSFRQQMLDSFA